MKIAVGLVVKGGNQFIDQWLECANKIADMMFVVDNGADELVRMKLLKCDKLKQYHLQKDMGRNQSRDYQKILEMAREEDCTWIFNLDIDEKIPSDFEMQSLQLYLLNTKDDSIGFPMFEMRGDDNHFVMAEDYTGELKPCRLVHKCYKILSHFKFNEKDVHGTSIPHNCTPGGMIPLPLQHYGHFTKELREEKRRQYVRKDFKDTREQSSSWLEEDDSKIVIKEYDKTIKEIFPKK